MKPTPLRAGEHEHAGETYILRRGELEVWTEALYGDPDDIADVADDVAGEQADLKAAMAAGDAARALAIARAMRCILHGGDDGSVQSTNAGVGAFRLADGTSGSRGDEPPGPALPRYGVVRPVRRPGHGGGDGVHVPGMRRDRARARRWSLRGNDARQAGAVGSCRRLSGRRGEGSASSPGWPALEALCSMPAGTERAARAKQ